MLIWMLIKRSASLASEAAAATFQCKRSWCFHGKMMVMMMMITMMIIIVIITIMI